MKKLFSIFMLMFLALTVVGCKEKEKIVFEARLRTENVSSNTDILLSTKLSYETKKVYEKPKTSSNPEYWRIGQSPIIYFEYSRGSKFKLVSATISGSDIDGEMILSDNNPDIELGEGFKLDKLSVENDTAFIAEISTPEITEFSEITYDLKSIKIEVDGIEKDVSIPEESSHISILSDEKEHEQEIERMIRETKVEVDRNEVMIRSGLFSNDFGGSVSYNIFVNGEISEYQFWLNYVGESELTKIEIQAIILGSEMKRIEVCNKKLGASWNSPLIHFSKPDGTPLFQAKFYEPSRQVRFDSLTPNDGTPITIYRTIEGKNIESIEIIYGELRSESEFLYFILEGFSLSEVKEMISNEKITASTKIPVKLIVEDSVIIIHSNW